MRQVRSSAPPGADGTSATVQASPSDALKLYSSGMTLYFHLAPAEPFARLWTDALARDLGYLSPAIHVGICLSLFDLSFDGSHADWSPVRQALEEWGRAYEEAEKPLLVYYDGGTFLRIVDRRRTPRAPILRKAARDIYLACTEVRTLERLVADFAKSGPAQVAKLEAFLGKMVEERLMFAEGSRYVSLATAPTAEAAARRIRAMHERDLREAPRHALVRRRLPVPMSLDAEKSTAAE